MWRVWGHLDIGHIVPHGCAKGYLKRIRHKKNLHIGMGMDPHDNIAWC